MFSPQSGHFERCERPGGPSLLRKLSQALPFPERHFSTPKWFSNDPKWFPIPILRAGRSYGLLTTRRETVWHVFTFYSVESRWKFEISLSLPKEFKRGARDRDVEKATVTDMPYIIYFYNIDFSKKSRKSERARENYALLWILPFL